MLTVKHWFELPEVTEESARYTQWFVCVKSACTLMVQNQWFEV